MSLMKKIKEILEDGAIEKKYPAARFLIESSTADIHSVCVRYNLRESKLKKIINHDRVAEHKSAFRDFINNDAAPLTNEEKNELR